MIRIENKDKTGVYAWYNKTNNNMYVGSGVSLYKRLSCYFAKNVKNNLVVLKALNKYGMSNFTLYILEYTNINNLIEREQF